MPRTRFPMGTGGGFAGGLVPAVRDIAKGFMGMGSANQEAQAKGALLGAQAYGAEQQGNLNRVKAEDAARLLGLRDNADYQAELNAMQPGAGTIFKGGADANNLADSMLKLQKAGFFNQAADAIPASSTGADRANWFASLGNGGPYMPHRAVGDSGYAIDQGTGAISTANAGMAAIFGDKAAADVAYKKSQQNSQNLKYDMNRGAIVDMQDGTARSVTTEGGQPLPYQDKPLPTPALKMQQEHLDAIGTVSGLNKDLGSFEGQITSGNLSLGIMSNLYNKSINNLGISTEESRNLQSFLSTLEKLRNDSLRLNKGVQTEGDAQRAWDEMIQNLNDTEFVKSRLQEIQRINGRAVEQRIKQNNDLRANFGLQPMDYSAYTGVDSAIDPVGPTGGARPQEPPSVAAPAEDPAITELRARAANNPALAAKLAEMGY